MKPFVDEAAARSDSGMNDEPRLGREAEAKLALENTRISRGSAWLLTGAFLLTIFSVPLWQHGSEIQRNLSERRAQELRRQAVDTQVLPQFYNFTSEFPTLEQIKKVRTVQSAWALIPTAAQFQEYENALQDDSPLVQWTLPRVQNAIVHGGVGNEQAYLGRLMPDGRRWLHYRADVDYVTSRGFLDPALLRARKRAAGEEVAQPDPIRAIVNFRNQLKKRGIELLVMPTPVKAMMQPETLSARYEFGAEVLQNPSFDEFAAALKREQVEVFDPSSLLLDEMRRTRKAVYLESDTHWTPPVMETVARELANRIRVRRFLAPRESETYTRRETVVSHRGDIYEMLRMPPNQTFLAPQTVRVKQVETSDGEAWFPSRRADVLLLGDSFSNIYSLGDMGWGESAGFAEQLSWELKRPIDAITNNAGGSHVTREILAKDLARGRNRLKGKKLVIWQFAMRDLLSGNWKVLELPEGKRRGAGG